jgi:hypothetical protein
LKIFLSFLQSNKPHPIPAYSFWQYYIKNGIEEAGHQWCECPDVDWALGLVPLSKPDHLKWMEDTWSKTIAWLKKNPADIFLSYLFPNQVDTLAIREIQKLGIPCVNFYCDNVRDFEKIPKVFSVFDLNWVPEYKAVGLYKKADLPYLNLPMPIWVKPEQRVFHSEKNNQVTFIGSNDIQRSLLFEEIVQLNPQLPLNIYGEGWGNQQNGSLMSHNYTLGKKLLFQLAFLKHQGIKAYVRKINHRGQTNKQISEVLKSKIFGPVNFDQYCKLTAESMVTMGINRYPSYQFPINEPNTYSRLRDIEAPMLGACYLTEWTEGIENLYDLGNEIETFKNAEDFIVKATGLQKDKQKREKLKINGQKRALNNHSIHQSINAIIQRLN